MNNLTRLHWQFCECISDLPENERIWEKIPSSTHTYVSFFEGEDTL